MSVQSTPESAEVIVVKAMLVLPDEGLSTPVLVQQLEATRFKLWSYPFLAKSVAVRDVIEAEILEELDASTSLDRIELRRVILRAGWSTYDFLCPQQLADDAEFQSCLSQVQASGGFTENLGDLYVFYWPPEVQLEPDKLLQALPSR